MSAEDPVDFLMTLIREDQRIPRDDPDFTPEVDLFDYGYLDAAGVTTLVAGIRSTFGVDMSRVDFFAPDYRSVAGIAAHIDRHRSA